MTPDPGRQGPAPATPPDGDDNSYDNDVHININNSNKLFHNMHIG